jgi:enoyl-CoA hydratase
VHSTTGDRDGDLIGRRRDGRVLIITMRRAEKRNAVDRAMADALDDALNELDDDRDLWPAS